MSQTDRLDQGLSDKIVGLRHFCSYV